MFHRIFAFHVLSFLKLGDFAQCSAFGVSLDSQIFATKMLAHTKTD